MFRDAFARGRRCLVPADGFYEWRAESGGAKRPYTVASRSGEPMALAGLWRAGAGRAGRCSEASPTSPARPTPSSGRCTTGCPSSCRVRLGRSGSATTRWHGVRGSAGAAVASRRGRPRGLAGAAARQARGRGRRRADRARPNGACARGTGSSAAGTAPSPMTSARTHVGRPPICGDGGSDGSPDLPLGSSPRRRPPAASA